MATSEGTHLISTMSLAQTQARAIVTGRLVLCSLALRHQGENNGKGAIQLVGATWAVESRTTSVFGLDAESTDWRELSSRRLTAGIVAW